MKWHVCYDYEGGAGREIVTAPDERTATTTGMALATPRWAADPSAPCRHVRTYRVLSWEEMAAAPHGGIETVVDLTWDRRDRGRTWLVVERGHRTEDLHDYWTTTARLVGTAHARSTARRMATARGRRGGSGARYDVVPRDAVQMMTSGAPYGCLAGDRTA
jgi:hypothetical protein